MIINGKYQIIAIDRYRWNNKCSDDEKPEYNLEVDLYHIKTGETSKVRGDDFNRIIRDLVIDDEMY